MCVTSDQKANTKRVAYSRQRSGIVEQRPVIVESHEFGVCEQVPFEETEHDRADQRTSDKHEEEDDRGAEQRIGNNRFPPPNGGGKRAVLQGQVRSGASGTSDSGTHGTVPCRLQVGLDLGVQVVQPGLGFQVPNQNLGECVLDVLLDNAALVRTRHRGCVIQRLVQQPIPSGPAER